MSRYKNLLIEAQFDTDLSPFAVPFLSHRNISNLPVADFFAQENTDKPCDAGSNNLGTCHESAQDGPHSAFGFILV